MHNTLQPLIKDQVKCGLGGAKVTCTQSPVETPQALISKHLLNAVQTVAVAASSGSGLGTVKL